MEGVLVIENKQEKGTLPIENKQEKGALVIENKHKVAQPFLYNKVIFLQSKLTQRYRYLFWELEKLGLVKIINFDHTNMIFTLQL